MQNENNQHENQYELPSYELLPPEESARQRRGTDIGQAEVVENMFGRARVRIRRESDTPDWVWSAAGVILLAAGVGLWLAAKGASRHAEPAAIEARLQPAVMVQSEIPAPPVTESGVTAVAYEQGAQAAAQPAMAAPPVPPAEAGKMSAEPARNEPAKIEAVRKAAEPKPLAAPAPERSQQPAAAQPAQPAVATPAARRQPVRVEAASAAPAAEPAAQVAPRIRVRADAASAVAAPEPVAATAPAAAPRKQARMDAASAVSAAGPAAAGAPAAAAPAKKPVRTDAASAVSAASPSLAASAVKKAMPAAASGVAPAVSAQR